MPRAYSRQPIEEVAHEVRLLLPHDTPERIATRLNTSPEALACRLRAHGYPDLARPFHALYARQERRARKADA